MTAAAQQAIGEADVIVGYKTYLRLIAHLAPETPRESSGMGQEVTRVGRAIDLAEEGWRVALVSGGDAGVYGMAGLVYDVYHARIASSTMGMEPRPASDGMAAGNEMSSLQPSEPAQEEEGGKRAVEIEVVPGVSALNAAAALLGAPLMTDFCAISLSDQLVPLDEILDRVELAAQGDFVIGLYNPKSRRRTEPFRRACEILVRHRPPETPVGIVRAAYREGQQVTLTSLSDLAQADVDMVTTVVVGNDRTYVAQGKMVTRRGYATKYDLGDCVDPEAA
jgi:precorrin-3B C17-methyltransferase